MWLGTMILASTVKEDFHHQKVLIDSAALVASALADHSLFLMTSTPSALPGSLFLSGHDFTATLVPSAPRTHPVFALFTLLSLPGQPPNCQLYLSYL